MKKKYESPMAEKYEFNYLENVVASGIVSETDAGSGNISSGTLKDGSNTNGCYSGANANKPNCTPVYGR